MRYLVLIGIARTARTWYRTKISSEETSCFCLIGILLMAPIQKAANATTFELEILISIETHTNSLKYISYRIVKIIPTVFNKIFIRF